MGKAKLRLKCFEEELSLERQCRKMEAKRELAEAKLEARIVCEDPVIANCKFSAGQDPNIISTLLVLLPGKLFIFSMFFW